MGSEDAAAWALATAIGVRVRAERRRREWSLEALAEASGVSRRMITLVEGGDANPSVGTLLRLAEALGLPLADLVAAPSVAPVALTRAGAAPVLWRGPSGGSGALVAGVTTPDVAELWRWTLQPGEARHSEPHRPGTHELLHVLAGEVVLGLGAETHRLATGDAASFPGDMPHAYRNDGAAPARFVLAVFEPAPGAGKGARHVR